MTLESDCFSTDSSVPKIFSLIDFRIFPNPKAFEQFVCLGSIVPADTELDVVQRRSGLNLLSLLFQMSKLIIYPNQHKVKATVLLYNIAAVTRRL